VFRSDGGAGVYGEGKAFAGWAGVLADGTFTAKVSGVAVGDYVTATATDSLGNTSEFALNIRVADAPAPPPTQATLLYLPLVSR
jgi:hypothetical protein